MRTKPKEEIFADDMQMVADRMGLSREEFDLGMRVMEAGEDGSRSYFKMLLEQGVPSNIATRLMAFGAAGIARMWADVVDEPNVENQ